ncbi:MAG: heme lyase CcmF/NrfE family subunit [Alphaproteobacteria bacterium]|nr:heme lyase CcmF/NrfE family subunit [Alphaproteobacteria bacterium]
MVAEIGQLALILAFLMGLCQTFAGFAGAHRRDPALMALARAAAWMQLLFVGTMFLALATSFLQNDLSVALVAQHSNSAQPAIYRIAATWGNHEGSMVLWVLILAVQGASVAWFGSSLRETLQARVLAAQAVIGAAFLGFSLFTSNPFLRLNPAPFDGNELNPLLQDPGLVFHPPVLYLGYVGFSAAFAFAVAALIEGRVDAAWARWVRPWVLASWIALTVGIAAGSCWAYYTLGWGGWWFWDPVENASLMPWLMGTALLHSSLVLEKRGALVSWTILLAILTFSLSLIGTFLVRSGVLTSVHAFALDAKRGVYILGIIGGLTGTALALFAWRAPAMRTGALFAPLSREGGITLNNVFLLGATAAVFLGTFYPVFVDLVKGAPVSVGPPYYRMTFVPIFIPLLILVSFGPMLDWKRNAWWNVAGRLRLPLLLAAGALFLAVLFLGMKFVLTAGGIALGVFLIAGAAAVLVRRYRFTSGGDWRRFARSTPLATYGFVLAHAGLGVTALGITAVSAFQTEKVLNMRAGQSVDLAGQEVRLESVLPMHGPNYQAMEARFKVGSRSGERTLISQRRFYPVSGTQTTDAGIGVGILGNTYVSVGDQNPDGSIVVRMWDHPLVDWIWAGAFLMAFGGMLSLADRRLRVGFAAPAFRAAAVQGAA